MGNLQQFFRAYIESFRVLVERHFVMCEELTFKVFMKKREEFSSRFFYAVYFSRALVNCCQQGARSMEIINKIG